MMDLNILRATGQLRKLQLRMLDILVEIDKLCRANGIRYYLAFGTLLGAVRHKGFIPWDDDMDIIIFEDDYDRFLQVCTTQLPAWLALQCDATDPDAHMGIGMCKIQDKESLLLQVHDVFRTDYGRGAFLDVYRGKTYPGLNTRMLTFLMRRISFAYCFFRYNPPLNFHNIVCYFLYPVSYRWHKFLLWLCTVGRKPYYHDMMGEGFYMGKQLNKISDVFPLSEIEFEGHKFFAPADTDRWLRNYFGDDYMQLPAPCKRRIHAKYYFENKEQGQLRYDN